MAKADKQSSYNFIDLFAGAGGLSEGFIQAGFRPVTHVEMNEYAAKTLETRSAYYYLKNSGNLALYGKYLSGDISRDELMKMIPASVTKTVINETLSDETLPAVFETIDGIMKIRGIRKIDVMSAARRAKHTPSSAEPRAATWRLRWRMTRATTCTSFTRDSSRNTSRVCSCSRM